MNRFDYLARNLIPMLPLRRQGAGLGAAGLAGAVVAYLLISNASLSASIVAFATAVLMSIGNFQGWHLVWLFPLPLFDKGRARDALCLWVVALSYLLLWHLG